MEAFKDEGVGKILFEIRYLNETKKREKKHQTDHWKKANKRQIINNHKV